MKTLMSGQRLEILDDTLQIRIDGKNPEDIAISLFAGSGIIVPLERQSDREWSLSSLKRYPKYDIVAYIKDDRQGGFVNEKMPLTLTINDEQHQLGHPTQQLAALIIAEHYVKDGKPRLKICNEGYTFGINAYARSRGYEAMDVPFVRRGSASPAPSPAPRPWDNGGQGGFDTRRHQPVGSGSGVRVAPGLIVTNAHVIDEGQSFSIGRTSDLLQPIAVDPQHDLALLQGGPDGKCLPIRLGTPLWLGEGVIAAGYPLVDILGSDLKVTTGNVSGLTGGMGDISRFQFTAPIASGSSGGAIVDEAGNLVGITAAALAHQEMRNRGGTSENVNFGVRAALVYEMIAAAGMALPSLAPTSSMEISASAGMGQNARRDISNRLRQAVVSIQVMR